MADAATQPTEPRVIARAVTPPEPERKAFDLNAARAARREAAGEPTMLVAGEHEYALPPAVPISTIDLMAMGLIGSAIRDLLGKEPGNQFLAEFKPDLDDLTDLLKGTYGYDPGESPASGS